MKKHVLVLGLLAFAWLVAAPMSASTFLAMDQKELILNSDSIVEGKVVAVESMWDREGRVILSYATVRVEDTLFGKADRTVRVQTFGGEVDGYTIEAAGFPKFEKGAHVLLFLNQREALDKSTRVTGYQQGHYRVVERDHVKMAVPTVDEGSNLINRRGHKVAPQTMLPLDDLRTQIRKAARDLEDVR